MSSSSLEPDVQKDVLKVRPVIFEADEQYYFLLEQTVGKRIIFVSRSFFFEVNDGGSKPIPGHLIFIPLIPAMLVGGRG